MQGMRIVWPAVLLFISFYVALWAWGRYGGLYDPQWGALSLRPWLYTCVFFGAAGYLFIRLPSTLYVFPVIVLVSLGLVAFFHQAKVELRSITADAVGASVGVVQAKVLNVSQLYAYHKRTQYTPSKLVDEWNVIYSYQVDGVRYEQADVQHHLET